MCPQVDTVISFQPDLAVLDTNPLAKDQKPKARTSPFSSGNLIPIQLSRPMSGQHGIRDGSLVTFFLQQYSKLCSITRSQLCLGALIGGHAGDPLRRWQRTKKRSTDTGRGQGQVDKYQTMRQNYMNCSGIM